MKIDVTPTTCPAIGEGSFPPGCSPLCRACDHRSLSRENSEAQKRGWLASKLAPWADRLASLEGATETESWGYRDRVRLHVRHVDGRWRFGMLLGDELLPLEDCPVHSSRVRRSLALLGRILPDDPRLPLAFYVQSGAQATLIVKSRTRPDLTWTKGLDEGGAESGLEGLWLHLHPSAGRRLFANREWILLWGQRRSQDTRGLVYGPCAFQQLLPRLYERSLDEAEAFLAPRRDDAVVDLYCGNGASLVRWLRRGAAVVGVELSGEAMENAAVNGPGASLLRGCCAERIPQLDSFLSSHARSRRLAYVNPPRTGLEPEVARWLPRAGFRRIAYLSCSAGTLRRDMTLLEEAGYDVIRLRPYDFFPRTRHVECLALLSSRDDRP